MSDERVRSSAAAGPEPEPRARARARRDPEPTTSLELVPRPPLRARAPSTERRLDDQGARARRARCCA